MIYGNEDLSRWIQTIFGNLWIYFDLRNNLFIDNNVFN